jgi:hypothetical protein
VCTERISRQLGERFSWIPPVRSPSRQVDGKRPTRGCAGPTRVGSSCTRDPEAMPTSRSQSGDLPDCRPTGLCKVNASIYAVCRYEPTLLAKLASVHVHEYGSDDLVKTSSGIDLVIR